MNAKSPLLVTVLLCLLFSSCHSLRRSDWSFARPPAGSSLWDQVIPSITFSNTPLREVAATLQSKAHGVTIAVLPPPDPEGQDTGLAATVSLSANDIPLSEALLIIAQVSNCGVFYSGSRAVFAYMQHGDGCVVRIRLHGRCIDQSTKLPVTGFFVERVRFKEMGDPRLASARIPIRTDSDGQFCVTLPVYGYANSYHAGKEICYRETFPSEQVLVLSVMADGYVPQTHELSIVPSQKEYVLDITLRRSGQGKPPEDDVRRSPSGA